MSSSIDKSLDEILSERQKSGPRDRRGGRRNDRSDYPRDGVRKSAREDPSARNMDSDWVHDKFDERQVAAARRPFRSGRRPSPEARDSSSAKLRVENLHYDLTEEDLDDLFNRIGPVARLVLTYDRAGRSNGVCYVTYESVSDAKRAVREYDGANANGQPIHLVSITDNSSRSRNPFDTAVPRPKALADRITMPNRAGRLNSTSPIRRSDVSGPPPANVDRYVPGQNSRSRSPMPRRQEGRRPGAKRERAKGKESTARDGRPKKTQEELDAEMEAYWGGGPPAAGDGNGVAAEGDIDMAE